MHFNNNNPVYFGIIKNNPVYFASTLTLQEVTDQIRTRTGHLPGVAIAVMGCIVNGPGAGGSVGPLTEAGPN